MVNKPGYYEDNKEVIKARSKARYENNKEICTSQSKDWKKRNPEKVKESQDKWLKNNPNYTMYHNAKRRAKDLGIPFTISFKDIKIPDKCPILGIEFHEENKFEHKPSLDRVFPEKGYTAENIRVISMRANRIKSDGTAEEHQLIANYIISLHDSRISSSL